MKRIIIDCDPGIDDAQAIMMAYQHPDVVIEAITTVCGNVGVGQTTANALKVLDVLGAGQIPVYSGSPGGLVESAPNASFVHGEDGLGDAGIPASDRKTEAEHAALALIRMARENPNQLELIAIGPLTNLALALHLEPELPKYFNRLVVMGGAYLAQGNTENLPAEFNLFADPDAAKVVFDHWPGLTMVSWEATVDHAVPLDMLENWMELGNPRSVFLKQVTHNLLAFLKSRFTGGVSFAADPLAMAVLMEPEIVLEMEKKFVKIERHGSLTRGMTVVDWFDTTGQAPNVQIVRKVDKKRFFELFKMAFE